MTTARSLIARLRAVGVSLRREGTMLVVESPAEIITPELLAEMGESKQELLSVLDHESMYQDTVGGEVLRNTSGLLATAYQRHKAVQQVAASRSCGLPSGLALFDESSVHGVVE